MNIYKVREDLEGNGESSDFWNISEELRTAEVGWVKKYHFFRKPSISTSWHSKVSELLFVHDQKKIYGTEFLICTTQVPGILWTKTKDKDEDEDEDKDKDKDNRQRQKTKINTSGRGPGGREKYN